MKIQLVKLWVCSESCPLRNEPCGTVHQRERGGSIAHVHVGAGANPTKLSRRKKNKIQSIYL